MRAWRGRWSTTSPAATAGRPTDCWSTPATPQPRTSLRSPLISRSGQRLYAAAERKGDRQAGHACAPDPQAGERTLLPQGMAGAHGERSGQAVYALRQRIERINADRKNHGFGFLPVRGLIKAKAHALWHALANNLMAARRLRIETP